MKIDKSSRHSKITGNFAEHLVLYWLSKHGLECAYIDHVGIDILARNKITKELMGISVKSRSRNKGKEGQYMSIPNENIQKIDDACRTFQCKPYFAIVIDEDEMIKIFILSKEKILEYFPMGNSVIGWKMSNKWIKIYENDDSIIKIEFNYKTKNWWKGSKK
jgi:Holliday junction resolvase-like predicted endonuclease